MRYVKCIIAPFSNLRVAVLLSFAIINNNAQTKWFFGGRDRWSGTPNYSTNLSPLKRVLKPRAGVKRSTAALIPVCAAIKRARGREPDQHTRTNWNNSVIQGRTKGGSTALNCFTQPTSWTTIYSRLSQNHSFNYPHRTHLTICGALWKQYRRMIKWSINTVLRKENK